MKQEFTREEVINVLNELLVMPDVLSDATNNENTNYDAGRLLEIAEGSNSRVPKITLIDPAIKTGDKVRGSWKDKCTGKTYYQEGIVIEHPTSGKWVQTQPDGGITPLSDFFVLRKVD